MRRKIKTVNDIYIQRKSVSKGSTVYFRLHGLTSQIEKLTRTKEQLLERLEQINNKMTYLKKIYNNTKKEIKDCEVKNAIESD